MFACVGLAVFVRSVVRGSRRVGDAKLGDEGSCRVPLVAFRQFKLLVQALRHHPDSPLMGYGKMTGLVCASCLVLAHEVSAAAV